MDLREKILKADDLQLHKEWVPEWGVDVYLRTMGGVDRDDFDAEAHAARGPDDAVNFVNLRGRLLVRCIVDKEGKRVFKSEDAEALGRKSARALERIFPIALKMNGLSKEDIDALKKPSAPDPNEASGSS